MRAALIGAGTLAALYGLVAALLFILQRWMIFPRDRTPPDLARAPVLGIRPMAVKTSDGLSLLSWYMAPARAGGHVVLYLHGNAGNIGHRAYRLPHFDQRDWGVLLLEYRGYGGNPGAPSEAGLLTDARAGLAALQDMGFPAHRILLWGESLGTGLAVRLAVEQPVAAVLLEAPYTSLLDLAQKRYPFVPVKSLLLDHFDTARYIGAIRAPLLVMHGARDDIIPLDMGRAIFAAAHEPKELWIAPAAGHSDLIEAGAVEAAWDFVNRMER